MSGSGRISDLVARLERMSSERWRADLSLKIAGVVRGLIDDGFVKSRSPYGDAWRARKGKYSWPLLQKTRAMRRGWKLVQCDAQGFKFTNTQDYAVFQNYGTSKGIDPREMVPVEAFGLGQWREPIRKTVSDSIRDLIRGR
jgi:phage gpG-like protein